jgi:O-antigen/teichoic acid export membrane protein
MNKLRSIVGNELIYIGSDILIKAIAFVSMPFFLNAMSTEEFGEFNLYLTYSSIFVVFFGLNVSKSIVKYYIDYENSKRYLATAVWIMLIGSSIFSGLLFSVNYVHGLFEFESKILAIIVINTAVIGLIEIGLEVIRSERNAKLYGVSSLAQSLISTTLGLILVYNMKDNLAFWRLISVTSSGMIISGFLVTRLLIKEGIKGNVATAKYMLSYSIPLIPYTLSTTILAHVNKLFLSKVSMSELGIYSFASNLAMIVYIIAIALNRSLQPNLFEALRDGKHYRRHIKKNIIVYYVFYLTFIFGTDILIGIFGKEAYLGAVKVVPILILGYGYFFMYSLYINFMYYHKKNYAVSTFSLMSAGIAVLSNFLLIPRYGYFGAAIATTISYFSLFIFGSFNVSKKMGIFVFSWSEQLVIQMMLIIPVTIKIAI